LPNATKPNWQERSSYILENYTFHEESVLIGHSAGATVILSVLELLDVQIAKAILVAGFFVDLDKAGRASLMLQETYDRQKIATNAREITLINADNDPRGCTDTQARPVAEKLGATFVLAESMGHM
jgi:predicted alpha/beta hydrolase family esterase